MMIQNRLYWLNAGNETGGYQAGLAVQLMDDFPPHDKLVHLEVGCAYGGAVEFVATLWKDRGVSYGYDTFEGHPEDLAEKDEVEGARAMDIWYEAFAHEKDKNKLSYDYQRRVLNEQGLTNALLVKGRINKHSFDDIEKAHLVMLDLDLIKPTRVAYYALRDKIVRGGYLLFHDALPPDHLPLIHNFVYREVLNDDWAIVEESPLGYLTALKKKWKKKKG